MQISPQLHAFIWRSSASNNCNTYLIDGPARILIDPGHLQHFEHVQTGLSELGIPLEDIDLIICTHAHLDHLEAVQLFSELPALFATHAVEWQTVRAMAERLDPSRGSQLLSQAPDFFLGEGELKVKGVVLDVYHCPGHSPGSVSLYWAEEKALITGDLIFKDGVGRTDLPQGNGQQLKDSIKKIAGLDAASLLSGHGDVVLGEEDVASNFKQVEERWFAYI
jgi:hydroxyacylglutathione hydrolase